MQNMTKESIDILAHYWNAFSNLLKEDIEIGHGYTISLTKLALSEDKRISGLCRAFTDLQSAVNRQFESYDLSVSSPILSDVLSIAPWMLESRPITPPSMVPSVEKNNSKRSIAPAPRRSKSSRLSDVSQGLPYRSDKVEVDVMENLLNQFMADLEGKRNQHRFHSCGEEGSLLVRLLDCIASKIAKTKWGRDLQEIISDYALHPNQYDPIRDKLSFAGQALGSQCVKFVATSPQRPCWLITGDHIGDVFGENEKERFTQISGQTMSGDRFVLITVHSIYILYDYDRELLSIKAICCPSEDFQDDMDSEDEDIDSSPV